MTSSRPAALIVEDQPFVGMVASDILRESGFETFHAFDADVALNILKQHPEIEVLLTEKDLPGQIDGVELSRRVASERPDVRLVLTSREKGAAPDGLPEGARVLCKPFATAELTTLVSAMTLLQEA